jgi:hypothetical protein
MAVQIQLRRGTAAQWTSANPILAQGEMGIETDTSKYKIGNGSTAWSSLDYSSLPSGVATLTGSETLTNKTLTSPLLNQPILNQPILNGVEERWSVSTGGIPSTLNLDVLTSTAWVYTGAAGANWTLNVRGNSSGTTLNSLLVTGDSITVALAVWMTTARHQISFSIDGNAVTPRWQGDTAPTSGNADSFDVYVFTIVKIAETPTFVVFGSRTQFK